MCADDYKVKVRPGHFETGQYSPYDVPGEVNWVDRALQIINIGGIPYTFTFHRDFPDWIVVKLGREEYIPFWLGKWEEDHKRRSN